MSTSPTPIAFQRRPWIVAWWPALSVAALIFAASSMPAGELPRKILFHGQDKLLHAIAYALLGFAVARGRWLRRRHPMPSAAASAALTALWALAYGISDEFHQSFVPGRSVELLDAVADLAGGIIGAVAFALTPARGLFRR